MPLPSLYLSGDSARDWSVAHAAAYGAAIGAVAALFKTLGPFHSAAAGRSMPANLTAGVLEIAAATLAFALLCAGAAALRNFLARRLIWPGLR
jgi:hypothetical protein